MKTITSLAIAALIAGLATKIAEARPAPVGTAFTYQGQLKQGGNNVNATADFEFRLFDVPAGGTIIGSVVPVNGVTLANGLFTVDLDFGPGVFDSNARWLDIAVRSPASSGLFTTLSPRQQLRPTPVAQFAFGADGPNLTNLNATNLASGTVADTRLSGNVGLLNAAQTFTGANTFSAAPSFTAAGSPFSVTSATLVTNLNADLLDGLNSSAFLQSIPVPLTLSGTSATHIIRGQNASTSFGAAGVYGLATASSGTTFAVYGHSDSTDGRGVYGEAAAASGATSGIYGLSTSTSGRGVFGEATSTTGLTSGLYGLNASTSGVGARGYVSAATGITAGVYGQSDSTSGLGVWGLASAASGTTYGVYGQTSSTSGRGVYGLASAASGITYGVYGQSSSSTDGSGVFGFTPAGTGGGTGVHGRSDSTSGAGVMGEASATAGTIFGGYFSTNSTAGRGVYGLATATSGTTYGVYGQASTFASGYAVYANGDTGASGTKSFRIDHPDDPANKYLLHYAAESPEVINFYRGTVRLDGAGEAVVDMPHYFARINKDPSYTLTAVGAAMPNLHIADEISDAAIAAGGPCWFRIAGGAPGMKVSWRVEALRNDLWVQTRGAPVEVEKQGPEKGTYQHPELYGQPPEKGMNYDAMRAHRPAPTEQPAGK